MPRGAILFPLILMIAAAAAVADDRLSETAIFNRCYSHLTQLPPPRNHPLLLRVSARQLSAVDACMSLLQSANLQSNGTLAVSSSEGLAVLRNMNDLHRSFFPNDNFSLNIPNSDGILYARTNQIHDEGEGGLHVTRALFYPGAKVSDIATYPSGMEAIRANGPMVDGYKDADNIVYQLVQETAPGVSAFTYKPLGAQLVQTGQLLGVRPIQDNSAKASQTFNAGAQYTGLGYTLFSQPIQLHANAGAGVIGSRSYMLMNFGRPDSTPNNGGLRMPRRWAKAVLHDVLCRDVPSVRDSDAALFVQKVTTSRTPPFRTGVTCMSCHSSMDPMAATARNYSFYEGPYSAPRGSTSAHLYQWPVTLPREVGQVDDDPDFHKRPPFGRLFFRSYNGTLVSQDVGNLGALGQAIAQTDDFYVCRASQYFQYFTGIQVNLQDIGDASKPALSKTELDLRNIVIQLGLDLKKTQSLQLLIREILESDAYQRASSPAITTSATGGL